MKIVSIGGGPAGLYFAILVKRARPEWRVRVVERNKPDDTFGFGVVFSDATLGNLEQADPETYARIAGNFAHWDDIDIFVRGHKVTSTGHGFCGLGRHELLQILQRRAKEIGVELEFEREISDVEKLAEFSDADLILAADGVGSGIRNAHEVEFGPDVDARPNRFVWLGTTVPYKAFTFYFKENESGLWRVHAYRYKEEGSTFIVETTEDCWRRAGMDRADEDQTIAYLGELFSEELDGHPLIKNRSIWRQFPTVRNRSWSYDNVVLMGDAAHTAHFSIGSGTKLAMEDAIALRDALVAESDVRLALATYEAARRPSVEKLQRAAQISLEWFEQTERYINMAPVQFAFSCMTRSLRVSHDNLRRRDPQLVEAVDQWFAEEAGAPGPIEPWAAPFRIKGVELSGRSVGVAPSAESAQPSWFSQCALRLFPTAVAQGGTWEQGDRTLCGEEDETKLRGLVDGSPGAAITGARLYHAGPRGWDPQAASSVPWAAHADPPRVLEDSEVAAIPEAFADSARLAAASGCEWLELDFADGGLVATFLSPISNRRDDRFAAGQAVELAKDIVRQTRRSWGQKPLSVRLCCNDHRAGGIDPERAISLASAMIDAGADLIGVTSGYIVAGATPPEGRLARAQLADQIRNEARVKVIAEGGIASHDDISSLVAAGRADLCVVDVGS